MSSDEGLWIGRRGHRMNSKVRTGKQDKYGCIDVTKLRVYNLGLNMFPRRLLLAPYRWPGLRVLIGCDTNSKIMLVYIVVFVFDSLILWLLSWAIIFMGLDPNTNQVTRV
jgi:hypothetical protein